MTWCTNTTTRLHGFISLLFLIFFIIFDFRKILIVAEAKLIESTGGRVLVRLNYLILASAVSSLRLRRLRTSCEAQGRRDLIEGGRANGKSWTRLLFIFSRFSDRVRISRGKEDEIRVGDRGSGEWTGERGDDE